MHAQDKTQKLRSYYNEPSHQKKKNSKEETDGIARKTLSFLAYTYIYIQIYIYMYICWLWVLVKWEEKGVVETEKKQ